MCIRDSVHAKSFVSDDKVATIGTVNLDYRSLFLHFENNSFFYRSSIIAAIDVYKRQLQGRISSFQETVCNIPESHIDMILLFLDTIIIEYAIIFYYNIKKSRVTRKIQ